jgi:hypothetical protein
MSAPGVVAKTTCEHCGTPLRCCAVGRTRGAVGHGGGAEGEEGGDAAGCASEAAAGAQGSLFA